MFNSRTYVSAQEHGTLQLIFFVINIKWALRWQIRVLLVIECAAAHKLKPGLSLTVKSKRFTVRASKSVFSVLTLFHGICHITQGAL